VFTMIPLAFSTSYAIEISKFSISFFCNFLILILPSNERR
jgi:hypothetical protein